MRLELSKADIRAVDPSLTDLEVEAVIDAVVAEFHKTGTFNKTYIQRHAASKKDSDRLYHRMGVHVDDGDLKVTTCYISQFSLDTIWGDGYAAEDSDEYHGDPSFIDGLEEELESFVRGEIRLLTDANDDMYLVARIR